MIRVSDHALVRFLERVGGFDVEQLRGAIEASLGRAAAAAAELGFPDHLIVADGFVYIVREGVVVTMHEKGTPAARAAILARPKARSGR